MKLRNKKTGEVVEDGYVRETHDFQFDGQKHVLAVFKGNGHRPPERVSGVYTSLAELNEVWEDYEEEPKEYWYIDDIGVRYEKDANGTWSDECRGEIGNYFEAEEEADRAIEKLKAWKKLKDKGFKFDLWDYDDSNCQGKILTGRILFRVKNHEAVDKLLDLLFGGEE